VEVVYFGCVAGVVGGRNYYTVLEIKALFSHKYKNSKIRSQVLLLFSKKYLSTEN
jgi:hypothetical protein